MATLCVDDTAFAAGKSSPVAAAAGSRTWHRVGRGACLTLSVVAALGASEAIAEPLRSGQPAPVDTLARETSDPTSDVWIVPITFGFTDTPSVPYRQSNQFSIEVQPSMPVTFDDRWLLLNLPTFTLASEGTSDNTQATGVENFTYLAAVGPVTRGVFAWALGPYVSFPVATDRDLAVNQWQFGPGAVARIKTKDHLASVTVKAGFATARQRQQAGQIQIEYNYQRFLQDGWQVGLGRPTIEYTWRRGGNGVWNVPVGLDVAKTTYFGHQAVKFMLQYELMAVNASRWKPQHQLSLVVMPILQGPP